MKQYCCCAVTEEEMLRLGNCIAGYLFAGAFVALYGDMGAGKTVFSRGIGEALGTDDVCSPTFTIVQEHTTQPPLFHFDAYRVNDAELYDIGWEDYLARGGIILMEWPQNVPDLLPKERLEVEIKGSGLQTREISVRAIGAAYENVVAALEEEK